MAAEYVFGYGSLVADPGFRPSRDPDPRGFVADVAGCRRGWGVAMDNRRDLPGYKYYTAPDGSRPALYVCFLDLADDAPPGTAVNGLCAPVDAETLSRLDRRERNYVRRDVSDRLNAAGARVWAYVGRDDARERLREGRRNETAAVAAAYLHAVRNGFAALGEDELAACEASLDPGDLPVRELARHEL
ncbi:MAG: gamma-glutamylcyclotransferase [Solirubrobacterales bacterium]|nr:gamma-glutamylcyclotransferase [Solirubrobacterales bacterium]